MKNYEKIITNSLLILNNYADSIQSISIIPKIYLASLRIDSTGNEITELKALLETLILKNPNNEPLISQSYYFIQKCKVALGQYQSAMTGFQQIINQNPYSYEGLVASWDYAATSLLLSGGSGGGEKSNYELPAPPKKMPASRQGGRGEQITNYPQSEASELKDNNKDIEDNNKSKIQDLKSEILKDDPNDKYDTKVFTKEDRQVIRLNIFNSFESSRDKETEKIKSLEKKISEGTADESEKSELKNKIILKEIVKVKIPHDIAEHINFVNKDLQILFGSGKDNSITETKSLIPTQYSLSQNYPNPFNPITNLEFACPPARQGISEFGFVTLKVYDILGKEVKTLVNENKSAGNYIVKFDGSNLSSGVYFYRLEAGDFIQTKRMVLLK